MSTNDMSERVDFKDVLNASAKRLRLGVAGPKNADQLEGIAVAVAELIEADREYDEAEFAWREANRNANGDESPGAWRKEEQKQWGRFSNAASRRTAALARFGDA